MTQPTNSYPPPYSAPPPGAYLAPPAQGAYPPAPVQVAYPPAQMAQAPSFESVMALVPKGSFDGTDSYDGSEFDIPRIRIVQTATQQQELQVQVGHFSLGVGNGVSAVEGVIVAVAQSRWFGPGYDEAQRLKNAGQPVNAWCRSLNGKVPEASSSHRQGPSCQECPKRFDGCQQSRHLGLLVGGSVYELTVRNKACKDVDRFVQDRKLAGQPVFVAQVRITARPEKSAQGTVYYLPTIQVVGPASREDVLKAQEIGPGLLAAITRKGGDGAEAQPDAGRQAPDLAPPPAPPGPPVVDASTGAPVAAQWEHPTGAPQPPLPPPGVGPNSPVTPQQSQQTWAYVVHPSVGYHGAQVAEAIQRRWGASAMEGLNQAQWAELMGAVQARQAL